MKNHGEDATMFEFDDVNFNWRNCEREFWIHEQSQRKTPVRMPIWIWIWWCEFIFTFVSSEYTDEALNTAKHKRNSLYD